MTQITAQKTKEELEEQLDKFLTHTTIEVLRDKLHAKYRFTKSFLHPDIHKISQELDKLLLKEQKKRLHNIRLD